MRPQPVYDLLKRLHPGGGAEVIVPESGKGKRQYLADGSGEHAQLTTGGLREGQPLVIQLTGGLQNIFAVVGDAFKIADQLEKIKKSIESFLLHAILPHYDHMRIT